MDNGPEHTILDEDSDFDSEAVQTRHRRVRMMLMTLIVFCGAMIALVVLSQSRTAQVQSGGEILYSTFARTDGDIATADPKPAPAVSVMPANRVPVRRSGLLGDN